MTAHESTDSVFAAPPHVAGCATATASPIPSLRRVRSGLITDRHLGLLAIVYVRQSTPQQIVDHRESRERQYALVSYATALGWPQDRTLTIDEDQGISGKRAENRSGFRRLLTEVTMEHVGLILGIEMSRLARSNKDWHHLLELCAIFGTILADEDGLYDPRDPNDRLLLGLKGTMSEYELITMHNRLEGGKLQKAQRCELIPTVPCGYLKLPNGEVVLDPDEQARSTVRLVFDKFDELRSFGRLYRYLVRNSIRLGMRVQRGARRGQLEWRQPTLGTVARMLHHPIYAGAYSYGRRRVDHKRAASDGGSKVKIREVPMSQWRVLQTDRLPAYITWDHFLANQERLLQNRYQPSSVGAPRDGKALLTGILVCGSCGRRMHASYRSKSTAYYDCMRRKLGTFDCRGLATAAIDDMVTKQVLQALEPAAVELSLKAIENVQRERQRLNRHWEQRLERASYDAQRAERQYQAVEPENRLVARSLEQQWEAALRAQRDLREEYDRFLNEQTPRLTEEERSRILAVSADIPALWHASGTTARDRKEIIRLLIERVVVDVRANTERAEVTITWRGGQTTRHEIVRSVSRYESLGEYDRMMDRIVQLRRDGLTIKELAAQLNREGYHTPRTQKGYTPTSVRQLLSRRGLTGGAIGREQLESGEWWLPDLAKELGSSYDRLREWALLGKVRARRVQSGGPWVVWADGKERRRLRKLIANSE
jgi:DNA invertase Pin-like site-specific DNA recombinase